MAISELRDISLTSTELRQMLNTPNFFGRLHPYLSTLLSGNPVGALNEGMAFLAAVRQLDSAAYQRQHKGTPFYWLGISAFLAHDYQTAVFFFDAAVSEDIRNGADITKSDTPALKFIYIEGETPQHAAQFVAKELQSKLNHELDGYNGRPMRAASLSDLTLIHIRICLVQRFLKSPDKHLRTLATAFISFLLEWNHRTALSLVGVGADTAEPFFIHLFKGCLLFESLLKENPKRRPTGATLGKVLRELHSELGIPSQINISSVDFASTFSAIGSNESVVVAIERTGKIRNTLGHNLGWPSSLDSTKYDLLAANICASCLHVINSLYR